MTNCNHYIIIIHLKIQYKHHLKTNNLLEENIIYKKLNKKIKLTKKYIKENKYMNITNNN